MWMSILDKNNENTQKTTNQRILNVKMSTKEAQFLYLACQRGGLPLSPRQLRQWSQFFQMARIADFPIYLASIVASQSDGNLAFTVHAVCSCACFQSSYESYSMLLQQQLQNQFSAEVHMSNQKTGL